MKERDYSEKRRQLLRGMIFASIEAGVAQFSPGLTLPSRLGLAAAGFTTIALTLLGSRKAPETGLVVGATIFVGRSLEN